MAVSNQQNFQPSSKLELWGGIECTVNRVRDSWLDQVERSGHATRLSDFDLFKDIGITTLRHPILWERTAPHAFDVDRNNDNADWSWADRSLARLRELEITPIVGLVHHGSGPRGTDLLDPEFSTKLAAYAGAVASRYPWVADYTPVNEPLTTARFSGLYGHWYPHAHDDLSFSRALLNQCRAVVLSMRAIRQVNSAARLTQTEDLGKIFSTPHLAYQAEFENERRWCSFDLLCGRVNRHHPMWSYFEWAGITPGELEWFLDNPCPPDVLGVNHYLSGERYLDEHLERYPDYTHGGNGRDRYADVLAARVLRHGPAGPKTLLREAWERYRLPVAVTECHNGCTREEQLRWLFEVWNAAKQLRDEGVNLVAVTAWSLLGGFDWNSLVTRDEGCYEPGVFDIRSPRPRATALVACLRKLTEGDVLPHPILDEVGWWKRPKRFVYGVSVDEEGRCAPVGRQQKQFSGRFVRPLLIAGGRGKLALAFSRVCEARGIAHHRLSRAQLDNADYSSVRNALDHFRPWAVINAAGFPRVGGLDMEGELEKERCYRENTQGPQTLAAECAQRAIQLLTFSSDMVFDGEKECAYVESDSTSPVNFYGVTQAEAERAVTDMLPSALIVRSGPFFSPWDEDNFLSAALRALAANEDFQLGETEIVSPTYTPDLVNVSLDLLIDAESGIWHLANVGQVSKLDLLQDTVKLLKLPEPAREVDRACFKACNSARRRLSRAIISERATLMPALLDALNRFAHELEFDLEPAAVAA